MGSSAHFQKLCQVETRRLLLVIGMIFAAVLVFQSSLLPYGNVLSSLISSKSMMVGELTLLDDSNSTDSFLVLGAANAEDPNKRKEIKKENETEGKVGEPDNNSQLQEDRYQDNESSFEKIVNQDKNSTLENVQFSHNGSALEKSGESEQGFPSEWDRKSDNEDIGLALEKIGSTETDFASQPPALPPVVASTNLTLMSANSSKIIMSKNTEISSVGKQPTDTLSKNVIPGLLRSGWVTSNNNSTMTSYPLVKKKKGKGKIQPTSISKMNNLWRQSRVSSSSMRPQWSSIRDQELLSVKSQIENAPIIKNDPELYASLFRNVSKFKRSYELMERMLKVYIYREGEKPIFHEPILQGIYASEGWFMKLMEGNKQFIVKDPRKAHLFYLPFSSQMLRLTLYACDSQNWKNLAEYLNKYVDMIAAKYHFWNRTGGADHFLAACHDWAPKETSQHMGNCIRALCNANVARGFTIGKDVSLPVTYVRMVEDPLKNLGGKPPPKRPILAFFAGSMHGYLRPILLQYWENKDPKMKIFGPMPRNAEGKTTYIQHMKSSKYCICARGYEVHTPRVIEAIFYECIPVIISDNYVPPFFEVLDWEAFSVFIPEKDIPNLKNILLSITEQKYLALQLRVKQVQQHFLWHNKPVKYDIFHMTLHSIWYNRVFQIKPR